jgi:hypothetical protein
MEENLMCDFEWLPPLVEVSPWEYSEQNNTYEMLYQIFSSDIKGCNLKYVGSDVWIFPDIDNGKEKIFWHLTSREEKARKVPRRKRKFYDGDMIPAQRYPDLRRSERLSWVKPLIENPNESEILTWNYKEGDGVIKTYVWLKDYDFVVIMKKYQDGSRRLVTSFYVDSDYTYKDFERKYRDRIC